MVFYDPDCWPVWFSWDCDWHRYIVFFRKQQLMDSQFWPAFNNLIDWEVKMWRHAYLSIPDSLVWQTQHISTYTLTHIIHICTYIYIYVICAKQMFCPTNNLSTTQYIFNSHETTIPYPTDLRSHRSPRQELDWLAQMQQDMAAEVQQFSWCNMGCEAMVKGYSEWLR